MSKQSIIKALSLMLVAVFLIGTLTGCATNTSKNISLPAIVEGSIFGGKNDDSIAVTVEFNKDWITKADNTVYNKNLAAVSALLSADSYFREKDLDKGTQNRVLIDGISKEEYTFTTMLEALGFPETRHVESFKEKTYETDGNDSVTMNLGYCSTNKNDVYIAVIRGCFSAGEWISAFDPGAITDSYVMLTGEHPEWTDKNCLKGIDVAANRAFEIIDEFISAHDDGAKPNCILITGHSRGGDIAQIVGAKFEDNPEIKSYTYTFNASAVTMDETAQSYKSIFNVFDSGDLFSDGLPFKNEAYYRFGKTMPVDISSSSEIRSEIQKLKGRDDYCSLETAFVEEYRELFGGRFASRESLYESRSITEEFEEEAAATQRFEELSALIGKDTGLGLEEYCNLHEVETKDDGKYAITLEYYDAGVLISLAEAFAYGEAAANGVKSLFGSDDEICGIIDFVLLHGTEIKGGHLLANSYIISKY